RGRQRRRHRAAARPAAGGNRARPAGRGRRAARRRGDLRPPRRLPPADAAAGLAGQATRKRTCTRWPSTRTAQRWRPWPAAWKAQTWSGVASDDVPEGGAGEPATQCTPRTFAPVTTANSDLKILFTFTAGGGGVAFLSTR